MRAKAAFPTAFSSASSAPSVDAASLPGMSSASWNLQGALVQRQQAPTVGLQADHGVHLASGAALLVRKPHERRERARLAAGRGPRAGGARAPLVPALPAQLEGSTFPRTRARSSGIWWSGDLGTAPRAPPRSAPASPRATSDLMAAITDSNSRSSRSTPARAADSSSSAIALGPGGGVLDPPALRAVVAAQLCSRCSSAATTAASRRRRRAPRRPAALARAPRHRAVARHLVGPRSRASGPAPRPSACDLRLSSPFSIATLSALSSLSRASACLP